ncbi:MAG: phytoene desaturase family protein [bacterium]
MKIAVIGAGIGGLATAALLAKDGHDVEIIEKNEAPGGRAAVFEESGFRFDMGPSWYLMPDVFENFFAEFGVSAQEVLKLMRLDPSHRFFFEGDKAPIDIPDSLEGVADVIEGLEPGSRQRFLDYMVATGRQYHLITDHFLNRRYRGPLDLISTKALAALRTLPLLGSVDTYVRRRFKTDKVRKLLEYSLVFLGTSPYQAPGMYSMMAHVDYAQGVYYPEKGIGSLVDAMLALGEERGVRLRLNAPVASLECEAGVVKAVVLESGERLEYDLVISNADIHHTETVLLPAEARSYSEEYWKSRTLAPSGLLIYLGIKGRVPQLSHHNLYIAKDWDRHFDSIFKDPAWPENPSFYVCMPSATDPTVAPEGDENLFVFLPLASKPELFQDKEALADILIKQIAEVCDIPDLSERVAYRRVFGPSDFVERYHSLGGSALGLAHTLSQTAFLRPSQRSRRISNLYYVGAGVHPGIGMPVSVISAQILRDSLRKEYRA